MSSEIVATTAERLRYAIEYRHTSAAEVSRQTKISRGSLSQYMSGKFTPKQDRIYILANYLRVSPAWLMGVDCPMEGLGYKEPQTTVKFVNESKRTTIDDDLAMLGVIVHDEKTSAQIMAHIASMCDIVKRTAVSPEDKEILKKYHALPQEQQAVVKATLDSMYTLTQQNASSTTANDEEGEQA